MAGNLGNYTALYVTIANALLQEHVEVDVKRMSNAQVIKTVAKGFCGASAGAAMVEISVKNVIPVAGFEFNAGSKIVGVIPVEFGIVGPGGKVLKTKGFIMDDSFSHAVDGASGYSFNAVCQWADFQ